MANLSSSPASSSLMGIMASLQKQMPQASEDDIITAIARKMHELGTKQRLSKTGSASGGKTAKPVSGSNPKPKNPRQIKPLGMKEKEFSNKVKSKIPKICNKNLSNQRDIDGIAAMNASQDAAQIGAAASKDKKDLQQRINILFEEISALLLEHDEVYNDIMKGITGG